LDARNRFAAALLQVPTIFSAFSISDEFTT